MKTKIFILCMFLCLAATEAYARTINKIVFRRSLSGPVKLKDSGGGWYSVSNGETFAGNYNFIRGYDGNCNGLSVTHKGEYERPGDNRSDFIRIWYVGESVMPYLNDAYHDCPNSTSNSSSSSSNSSSSYSSYSGDSRATEVGERAGEAVGNMMSAIASSPNGYNESRVGGMIIGGISAAWGENLDFRFRFGSTKIGFSISGAVGTDLINITDKVLWNAGMGMYFGNMPKNYYSWDIGWDFKFGRTCMTFPSSYGLLIDLNTTHLFTRCQVIGITASVGIGGANLNSQTPVITWDASVGLVIFLSNFLNPNNQVD